jgi:hypothetical protein
MEVLKRTCPSKFQTTISTGILAMFTTLFLSPNGSTDAYGKTNDLKWFSRLLADIDIRLP